MRTLAALLALACTIQAEEFAARVVSIADGDTLTVLRDTMQVRVRLDWIDAPERAQPYGTRARQFTGDLAHGQDVTVVIRDYDRYERTVAEIILPDGRNLNYEIVRAGFAWGYRHTRAATKRWNNWSAKHGKVASGLGRLCAGAAVGMAATEAVSSQVEALATPV